MTEHWQTWDAMFPDSPAEPLLTFNLNLSPEELAKFAEEMRKAVGAMETYPRTYTMPNPPGEAVVFRSTGLGQPYPTGGWALSMEKPEPIGSTLHSQNPCGEIRLNNGLRPTFTYESPTFQLPSIPLGFNPDPFGPLPTYTLEVEEK